MFSIKKDLKNGNDTYNFKIIQQQSLIFIIKIDTMPWTISFINMIAYKSVCFKYMTQYIFIIIEIEFVSILVYFI